MKLPVMEHFYTIQGEGFYTGSPAYFIRLGGCDVGCVWCDVKDSWNADIHPKYTIDEIVQFVVASNAKIAVITGGEPAMYDLNGLCQSLGKHKIRVHIETSGAHEIKGTFDWVCLSPKKFKPPLPSALALADEFKVVVFHSSDIEWSEQFLPHLKETCVLLLQPEWSKSDKMNPLVVEHAKADPKWRISLQTHKFLNIP